MYFQLRGDRAMNRRLWAMLLICAGIALGDLAVLSQPVEARNNSVITTGERPNVVCGAMGCTNSTIGHTQGVKGSSHGGGGGAIRISP
jgi:hypothetical protein